MAEQQILAQLAALAEDNRNLNARLLASEQQQAAAAHQNHGAQQMLAGLPAVLVQAMRGQNEQRNLVDNKGLGKPTAFDNNEHSFLKWGRKTANYMSSVLRSLAPVLQQAVDQEDPLDWDTFKQSVIEVDEVTLDNMNDQVYHCLMALTDGESFDLVVGSGEGNGFESWRRLHRR